MILNHSTYKLRYCKGRLFTKLTPDVKGKIGFTAYIQVKCAVIG